MQFQRNISVGFNLIEIFFCFYDYYGAHLIFRRNKITPIPYSSISSNQQAYILQHVMPFNSRFFIFLRSWIHVNRIGPKWFVWILIIRCEILENKFSEDF